MSIAVLYPRCLLLFMGIIHVLFLMTHKLRPHCHLPLLTCSFLVALIEVHPHSQLECIRPYRTDLCNGAIYEIPKLFGRSQGETPTGA